jgi:DNA replication and repair protein RecF
VALLKLDIAGVRNIQQATLPLASGFNFFYGNNGSGKTAILEAIFLLGRGRSFSNANINTVVSTHLKKMMVTGIVQHINGSAWIQGLQFTDNTCQIRINQQLVKKRADLAYALPLQVIHPKSGVLLEGSSQFRREFCDWGIFNDSPAFLAIWQQYKKILAYRNALLKAKAYGQLTTWEPILIECGNQITKLRAAYLANLQSVFIETVGQFLGQMGLTIKFHPGWTAGLAYKDALIADRDKDIRYGYTNSGPHRADFTVWLDGQIAKHYISRGQLKLLVISLLLSQIQLLVNQGGIKPCVLFDDFAAELDSPHRARVLRLLSDMGCQVFLTAIEQTDFGVIDGLGKYNMFHVEHGCVQIV